MNTKNTIIQSAIHLFSKKGFDGTSVREIAADAGVNVALINYYFVSKERLLESVVEYKADSLKEFFTGLINNNKMTAMEKLEIIIDNLIERKFSSAQFHHLLHRELYLEIRPQCRDVITDILYRNLLPVKKIIKKGIEEGEFNEVDVELTITTVIGTVHYLLTSNVMCRKILGKKEGFTPFQNKALKQRLSEHTKKLMRSYLLKK